MSEHVQIDGLMAKSGVQFGTSGARGLVVQMTDRVCVAYTLAFLKQLQVRAPRVLGAKVVIGGDLRPSTPRIARAVAFAALTLGYEVEFAGWVPSPAVALRGFVTGSPSVMVTGSHIPDDRNGIKFNSAEGELTKLEEIGIRARTVELGSVFDDAGMFLSGAAPELSEPNPEVARAFLGRYLSAFPSGCLDGMRIGVYGHSAVGRDLLVSLYEALGAEVLRLGFSETFIPVDTEAIRPEDVLLAKHWAAEHALYCIVSTDGDSDRPLISDEQGEWIRGDVAGILVAQFLGAQVVATPVSCNTAVERCGSFTRVLRTRIGSPYVIAAMQGAATADDSPVVGYEANGGFLTQTSTVVPGGGVLPALPTRDAVIVHLGLLLSSRAAGLSLSQLLATLPARFTASDRDQAFAQERSSRLFALLDAQNPAQISSTFGLESRRVPDTTDGYRFHFENGEIIHLRASGNAPELRCYAEAAASARAEELLTVGLSAARALAP